MLTLQKLHQQVKKLSQEYIPKAKRRRFMSGVQTLSLQEFSSLNRAGRQLATNRLTGETRIRRTVNDAVLSAQIRSLIIREVFSSRTGDVFCSLDHSQFGPFCIAVMAVSNRKGRAVPVWCQVNVSQGAMIAPLITALEELFELFSTVSNVARLVLVMDRWFGSAKLLSLLTEEGVYFIARTKSDKLVQLPWDPSWWKHQIQDISQEEVPIRYAGLDLRLIRSDFQEDMKDPEPWFLLTNISDRDTDLKQGYSRRQILNRYAERFEIEETFKDIKWLQRMEWQRVKKPAVIESLLHFIFLGWWLLWKLEGNTTPKRSKQPKHQVSWFRQAWEKLQTLSRPAELCFVT